MSLLFNSRSPSVRERFCDGVATDGQFACLGDLVVAQTSGRSAR